MFRVSSICVLFAGYQALATQAHAQDMKTELEALKAKVAQLEADQAQKGEGAPLLAAFSGIKLSGFVDSTYGYNFNSPTESTNVGRVFDRESNSFNLNAAKVSLQKTVDAEHPVGFRTDLYAGNDAEVIHSAGLGDSSDSFDLEQAYGELNLGLSKLASGVNDINFKAGKFVTLAGAEVIESKDNFNISRGFLFGYAVPFTHTGLRGTYTFDNG